MPRRILARWVLLPLCLGGCGPRAADMLLDEGSPHRVASVERMNEGIALIEAGKPVAGRRAIEEAVRIDPRNGDAWSTVGVQHFNEGRLEDARRHFERAAELFGDPPPPTLAYAHACTLDALANEAHDVDRERSLRVEALRRLSSGADPDDAVAHLLAAQQYERLLDLAAADAEYRRAIAVAPHDARAYARLGALYLDQGFEREGLAVLTAGTQASPGAAAAWSALGRGQAIAHAFEPAAEAYAHALDLDPAATDARFGLAMAQLELGRTAEATASFEAYLRDAPADRPVHVRVAEHRLVELHADAIDRESTR